MRTECRLQPHHLIGEKPVQMCRVMSCHVVSTPFNNGGAATTQPVGYLQHRHLLTRQDSKRHILLKQHPLDRGEDTLTHSFHLCLGVYHLFRCTTTAFTPLAPCLSLLLSTVLPSNVQQLLHSRRRHAGCGRMAP